MKITFLGTSHGVPSAERYCSCAMLESNGALYFVDAGAPLMDILLRRGEDLNRVRALFTTHLHGDHVCGILEFADLLNWHFKSARAQIFLTEARGIELFENLIEAMESGPLDRERVRFRLVESGVAWQDENIRVTPMPTMHMAAHNRPSYSYLVEAEGKTALFSGDLSQNLNRQDFPAYALEHPVDLLVLEMAHFGVPEAEPYLARCRAKQVLINHVCPLDKLDSIRALDGRFGYPVRAVEDGDTIEL